MLSGPRLVFLSLSLVALSACVERALEFDIRPQAPGRAETDERPRVVATPLIAADGQLVIVDDAQVLRVAGDVPGRALLDAVIGTPVALADGRILAVRSHAPGESDLWSVSLLGERPRAIAAAPGADGQPFVLDDGRVLFVSDRTGVAAVWIVEPARQQARQLTNHSARPGRLGAAFVPPPVAWTRQRGSVVEYDAGDARVVLDVDTATAEVL